MFECILLGKAIPEMTYTVLGGTLSPTHSFTSLLLLFSFPFFVLSQLLLHKLARGSAKCFKLLQQSPRQSPGNQDIFVYFSFEIAPCENNFLLLRANVSNLCKKNSNA